MWYVRVCDPGSYTISKTNRHLPEAVYKKSGVRDGCGGGK